VGGGATPVSLPGLCLSSDVRATVNPVALGRSWLGELRTKVRTPETSYTSNGKDSSECWLNDFFPLPRVET